MQLKFFEVPAHGGDHASNELNAFLRSHRIITVDRQFIANGADSSWSICVSFVEGAKRSCLSKRSKVDYRDVLSESDFAVYAKLRDLRKQLAAEEGRPIYAIFTNEQLAAMVQQRTASLEDLSRIAGIGEARIAKHGAAFLAILRDVGARVETGQSNGALHEA